MTIEYIPTTALDAVYQLIVDDPGTSGTTWKNTAPDDSQGLCREVGEADGSTIQTMGTIVALENPIIEVGVRGAPRDFATPHNEAFRLRYLLASKSDVVVNDLRILAIVPRGTLQVMGRDSTQREMFVVRFEVMAEPSYREV